MAAKQQANVNPASDGPEQKRSPNVAASSPGPWRLSGPKYQPGKTCGHSDCTDPAHGPVMIGYDLYTDDLSHHWLASIHGAHVRVPESECHANACLIAAAPELLMALQRCKFDSLNMSLADLEFCRAAIAKASAAHRGMQL